MLWIFLFYCSIVRQSYDYYYDILDVCVMSRPGYTNVRKGFTTTECLLISVLVKLWFLQVSFGSYWLENFSNILYSVLIICTHSLNTGPCRHKLKCLLVEISRNLQHLPQLSCRADLIRKPFRAITIINLQVTWRFVIRFDLIVNSIVVI